ncbi:lipid kinase YegS [Lysobacter auxotrophicus]|uniref:Probable lipid kinase YegS-like n=1 Tax=Lysobacter auxotrophicus TaxID=2992573 RepID=A0ABM8DA65_9GAMM|nr:lipid kinase YegS [Lysobacter auxotrophicus]BDU15437.1 lipid kinase YegS [Lysobacter auxotrophicus]
MATHWRLILNGKSAGNDEVRDAVEAMRAGGVTLDVRVTWERGDALRYVDEAIDDGVRCVIAAGGDGTLGEVAAALSERHEEADALPALAAMPLGTANDFATAATIPTYPREALQLIADSKAHAIDMLRVEADGERHWCVNLASGGFGTEVTVETDDGLKKLLGGLAYLVTGIARMGRIEPITAHIHGEGFDWRGALIALGIGNGRQAGGGQILCPDARIDDGLLDLTVIPELEGELGTTVATLMREGRGAALERVGERGRMRAVTVESDEPMALNLDGEPVQASRFAIACVPARLRMHLPEHCPLLAPARLALR